MRETKSEIIFEKLKTEIINQEISLNELIDEQIISDKYGVSRTPIREALNKLVQHGYLIKYPRRGYIVKELKLNEYYEIVQLRYVLESGNINIIIKNCSDEQINTLHQFIQDKFVPYEEYNTINKRFHMEVAALTGNSYLCNSLENVFELSYRKLSMEYYNSVKGDMHKNHRILIQMMLDRDIAGAVAILREELKRTEDNNVVWF